MFRFHPSFFNHFSNPPRRQRLDLQQPPFSGPAALAQAPPPRQLPEPSFHNSDEFRMYGFKITPCPRTRPHDWTQCSYAHGGERARRRDPRRFDYVAVACPEFRARQRCSSGDRCIFAHGVFEYWLHPARYRTRACTAGERCRRRVCFFAHGPAELRPETRYRILGGPRAARGGRGGEEEEVGPRELKLEFLERFRGISERVKGDEESLMGFEGDLVDCESKMVDVGWVIDLID